MLQEKDSQTEEKRVDGSGRHVIRSLFKQHDHLIICTELNINRIK